MVVLGRICGMASNFQVHYRIFSRLRQSNASIYSFSCRTDERIYQPKIHIRNPTTPDCFRRFCSKNNPKLLNSSRIPEDQFLQNASETGLSLHEIPQNLQKLHEPELLFASAPYSPELFLIVWAQRSRPTRKNGFPPQSGSLNKPSGLAPSRAAWMLRSSATARPAAISAVMTGRTR
jgi:hypothetical protein